MKGVSQESPSPDEVGGEAAHRCRVRWPCCGFCAAPLWRSIGKAHIRLYLEPSQNTTDPATLGPAVSMQTANLRIRASLMLFVSRGSPSQSPPLLSLSLPFRSLLSPLLSFPVHSALLSCFCLVASFPPTLGHFFLPVISLSVLLFCALSSFFSFFFFGKRCRLVCCLFISSCYFSLQPDTFARG